MSLDPLLLPSNESSASLAPVSVAKAPTRALKWLVAVCLTLVIVGGFAALGAWNARRAASGLVFSTLALPWDEAIPRQPGWAFVYVLFYPALLLPFAFRSFRQDLNVFSRVSAGYLLQLLACAPMFLMPIRVWHDPVSGSGLAVELLRLIYAVDEGFNVFPSMHVSYVSYLACVGVKLGGRRMILPLWGFTALIMASTLLVKQHYIVDLPAGLALGVATHLLVFRGFQSPFQNRTGPVSQ